MRELPVTLSRSPQETDDSDGYFEPLSPSEWWASIQPLSPGSGEGRAVQHQVAMRWHPQVTMDTRIVYLDPYRKTDANPTGQRELFVRGFQNVNERNEKLYLLCEEIIR
jgi:head-tail adaptor